MSAVFRMSLRSLLSERVAHPSPTYRLAALGFALAVYDIARSSISVYSFKLEYTHLLEMMLYPVCFVLCPWVFSRILWFTSRSSAAFDEVLEAVAERLWVWLAALSALPFFYERLLFLAPTPRLAMSLGGSAALWLGLVWWRSSGRARLLTLELTCALIYCVTTDADLSLSKMLLQLPNLSIKPTLKLLVKWGGMYLITAGWLVMALRWSARPLRLLMSSVTLLGLYLAVSVYQPYAHERGEVRADEQRGDVLLVVFDAMRGDALDFARAADPDGGPLRTLEALAARSVNFVEAHSGSLVTADSLPKLLDFQGHQLYLRLWPKKNQIRWAESLPGRLQRAGFEAHLLTDYPNQYLRGFDALDWDSVSSIRGRHMRLFNLPGDVWAALGNKRMLIKARRGTVAASVTETPLIDQLEALLRRPRTRPRFITLHLGTPHQPYAFPPYQHEGLPEGFDPEAENERFLKYFKGAPPAELASFKLAYAYALRASDEVLARALALMGRHGVPQRDLIIVTSDHGEVFGDHGAARLAHGGHLYQASHHVPLLLSGAGLEPERVQQPVSHTRVASTIYDVMKVVSDDPSQDLASASLLRRGADEEASFALRYRDRGGVAQLGPWRFIWSDHPRWLTRSDWAHRVPLELYDKRVDPREERNLISDHPREALKVIERLDLPVPERLLAPLKREASESH